MNCRTIALAAAMRINKIKVLSEADRKVKQDLDNIISSLKVD